MIESMGERAAVRVVRRWSARSRHVWCQSAATSASTHAQAGHRLPRHSSPTPRHRFTRPTTLKLLLTNDQCGAVIGKGGAQIVATQRNHGVSMKAGLADEVYPGTPHRACVIRGPVRHVRSALAEVIDVLYSVRGVGTQSPAHTAAFASSRRGRRTAAPARAVVAPATPLLPVLLLPCPQHSLRRTTSTARSPRAWRRCQRTPATTPAPPSRRRWLPARRRPPTFARACSSPRRAPAPSWASAARRSSSCRWARAPSSGCPWTRRARWCRRSAS